MGSTCPICDVSDGGACVAVCDSCSSEDGCGGVDGSGGTGVNGFRGVDACIGACGKGCEIDGCCGSGACDVGCGDADGYPVAAGGYPVAAGGCCGVDG